MSNKQQPTAITDPAGHITDIETSQGEHISYKYNYDQLTSKTYSERYWNDSHYEYGSPTDGNASGRVIKIQDASGIKERKYDRLGNIIHERHTIVQPYSSYTINLETLWNYDIWGRINTIEYPDGEKVTYDYDQGGGLTSIIGDKHGRITPYLTDIQYDHYGNRIHEIQGNDVETHYNYDPVTLRLKQMTNLSHQSGAVLQDNHYSYDRNGNLTNIEDHGQNRRTQYYEYDALNRLTYSKGNIDNQGTELWYESHYNYTANGKMQQKQTHSRKLNNTLGIHDIHTAYTYTYNNDQPNTIESIYDEESGLSKYYKWDGKGNMTDRYDEQNKTNTKMCWTEDNRMQAYVQMNEGTDKGRAAYYGYNTTGERYVRYIGTTINITQNGITFHRPILQSPVLYANSLITLNGKGYTKHYFEGDRRVCSKIGGGFTGRTEDDINDRIKPITGDEYDKLFEQQYQGMKETFGRCMETEMEHNLKYDPYNTIMENELGRDEDEPAFYYQGDHLGSSAYLTDEAGAITQTLNYLPYGEDWVDVHNNPNYLSRYKYNGKEKDPESGLHYYGARYYDSDISQWLSIDPMADKYPSLSPYNYCADNPVILVDPDGRSISEFDENGNYLRTIKDNWWHNLLYGRKGRIIDGNGNVIQSFKFADPKNDVYDLKNGIISKVYFVQENDIIIMLSKAGAFDQENKVANNDLINRYDYIKKEGQGDGKFDFSYSPISGIYVQYPEASPDPLYQPSSMLFLVDGVAHNHMNFGNFLFGAAGRALGLTSLELRMGAHWNSLTNPSSNGYERQFDSRDDQFSIQKGVEHANKHDYKNKYYHVIADPSKFRDNGY